MILNNKSTYGEFLNSEEKIATNILADRLTMLEAHEFITKKVAEDKKSKFTYLLTEKAIGLVPVILEFGLWGSQFHPPGLNENLALALKEDKEGTIGRIKNGLLEKLHTVKNKGII
jgi:DNA-binding HxlR family transcriptional regulator